MSLALTPTADHVAISGTIVDVAMMPPNGSRYPTPVPFADTVWLADTVATSEPRPPICGRDTVLPPHLTMVLPPVPMELVDGTRWEQRRIYSICQGLIPLRVDRLDSYVVTGRAAVGGQDGVLVTRTSAFTFAGDGVEGQHNVRITGRGSGRAELVLDTSAGRLLRSAEVIDSGVAITASGRTRGFSQELRRTTELRQEQPL